jgi:hypothetical protein
MIIKYLQKDFSQRRKEEEKIYRKISRRGAGAQRRREGEKNLSKNFSQRYGGLRVVI